MAVLVCVFVMSCVVMQANLACCHSVMSSLLFIVRFEHGSMPHVRLCVHGYALTGSAQCC
jgi:hypothetical protein